MTENLSCNNCPTNQKKRCKEQQEKKDNLINFYLREIEKTAALYGYDISKQIKELKQTMPRITRCDVVLEKQLKRKEQECEELKNKLEKAENNCIKVFNLLSELGEKYTKLKVECEKYKKCIDDIKIINKDLLKGICDNCDWHNTDGCDPEDFVCGELIKIKQKINEVENEKV